MRVYDRVAQMGRTQARMSPESPLEHVPFNPMFALNKQCDATQRRLQQTKQWILPLPHDQMQMVLHQRMSKDLRVRPRSTFC